MKIFQIIQKHYEIMGISSWQQQSTGEHSFSRRVLVGFLMLELCIVAHFMYIFYVANGYMEYVECMSTTSGSIITFVCFATVAIKSNILFKVIDNAERFIVNRCEYPKSKKFFTNINQQIERLSKIIFFIVLKIVAHLVMLPKLIGSFVTYFTTDAGRDSFQLPFPLWFPFDTNIPTGYLIAIILEYIVFGYEYFVIACTLSLAIGIFWFIIASTKRIIHVVHKINDNRSQANGNRVNEFKLFAEFIHAHNDMKQVANDFSDLFQPPFMTLLIWSLLVISGALLVLHAQISNHGDYLSPLLIPVVETLIALSTCLMSCEIGQRMSYAFDEINLTVDELNWYLVPIKLQRIFPLIVGITQQPIELECFGSISCCRPVFKEVVNSVFSYFMMLRQIVE